MLRVIERPMLVSGMLAHDNETGDVAILINSEQTAHEKTVAVWHEVIHLLRMAGNYSQEETEVEDRAQKLAIDCPQILEWVGLEPKSE